MITNRSINSRSTHHKICDRTRILTWIQSMNTTGYTLSRGRLCHSPNESRTRSVMVEMVYRRARCRPVRVVARTRRHALVYRGRAWALVLALILVATALAAGIPTGRSILGAVVAGVVVVAWLGYGIRVTRLVPAGPGGDGPAPPGGASAREPRRPLPVSPTGTAARQRDEDEPLGQAVALA
jgi:hypothetical protein